MTFSDITTTMTNCAKSINGLATQMSTQLNNQFGPTIDKVKDGVDVLQAGKDVVSSVVKDVTGENVTIDNIQKGASDFDEKWDSFAEKVNEVYNSTSPSNQTNILESFAKNNFGNEIYNLGSAVKNELPGVLEGISDYKKAIDGFKTDTKTAEDTANKIKNGADRIVKATEEVAKALNNAVTTCTGKGIPVLTTLSNLGGSTAVSNLNNVFNLGVTGATAATAVNQLKDSIKKGDLRGITDSMAKGATTVNGLLSQLNQLVPGFPNAQIPTQITNSILRLKDGQAIYDAAGSMLTALVADASGHVSVSTLAALTEHFDKNWDTFSAKIDALFQITPNSGKQSVLETLAKNMFGENVFYAGGAIKRQLPGVLKGITGVQDAINQFGGSYRNPIEAATKIRNGVEKMVRAIEKIGQSLNGIVKGVQGKNGTGYKILDVMGNLGDTKGIKALDTVLRIGGGGAAVVGNAGTLADAIKNKDIKGAVAAVKKTIDDIKKLTKKGDASGLTGGAAPLNKNTIPNQDNSQSPNPNNSHGNSAQSNSYVCSGATMRCTMGEKPAKLTVLPSRTAFLCNQPPMGNISDHKSMVNLAPFGRCRSLGFPATASATAAHHGHLTPMPCVHNTPTPWTVGKTDYLVKGEPALLKNCKCQCMWGGTISIIDDGQKNTGAADLSKVARQTTDALNKKNTQKQDDIIERSEDEVIATDAFGMKRETVLDGIQFALDLAGLVPVVGAAADLTNAAIYAVRGDKANAAFSLMAAVPGVGDAATAAKMVNKGIKVAKSIEKSAEITAAASKVTKNVPTPVAANMGTKVEKASQSVSKDALREARLNKLGPNAKAGGEETLYDTIDNSQKGKLLEITKKGKGLGELNNNTQLSLLDYTKKKIEGAQKNGKMDIDDIDISQYGKNPDNPFITNGEKLSPIKSNEIHTEPIKTNTEKNLKQTKDALEADEKSRNHIVKLDYMS